MDWRDVFSISEGQWVTDNVINAFIPAILSRLPGTKDKIMCMNTHLSSLIDDLPRTKAWGRGMKMHEKRLIIVPYHHSGPNGGLH